MQHKAMTLSTRSKPPPKGTTARSGGKKARSQAAAVQSAGLDSPWRDLAPGYLSIQDRDLRILEVNARVLRDFGDGVGRFCYEVYAQRNAPCSGCPLVKSLRDGKEHTAEQTIVTRDGRQLDVLVSSAPVFDQQGEVTAVMGLCIDATAVKTTRQKPETNGDHFRQLFEIVPCYISIQDRDFRIIESNNLFKEDFGDCEGVHCYQAYKSKDTKCLDCPVEKSMADGGVHSSEEVVVTRDGRTANTIIYAMPVRDERGDITAVMEVSTNITAIKTLQQELERAKRDFRRLFDIVPCHISIQDRDHRIIESNTMFKQDFGEGDDLLCYQAYKHRDTVCPECPVEKSFADGEIHHSEGGVVTKDGRRAVMMVSSMPIRDRQQGGIGAVMQVGTDITEIKTLQQELERSRQDYKHLFNMVPCYITIQDRHFRIISSNDLFRQDFGDCLGRHCYRAYKGGEGICPECPVARTFEDGQVHSSEELVITKDGRQAAMMVSSTPVLDDDGNIAAVMEVSTNVTEVKRLQVLATVGLAVTGMAHRIKNILMGLEGGIFVVNTGFEEDDQAAVGEGWDMVVRNVERISHIAKDLLFCSKERHPELEPGISPKAIARDVYGLFRPRMQGEGVELRLDLGEADDSGVFDKTAIGNLIANLVANAFDACRFDPNSRQKRHVICLRCDRDDTGNVIIEVADNGAGISEEDKPRVFDTFFSSKGTEGTGLGLLVVQQVAREHEGTVDFETEEGKGTTFRVVLPHRTALPTNGLPKYS